MYDLKTILLAKRIRRELDVTRLSVADIALLEIIKNASDSNPVRDATITNGIATFNGVVASSPLVSLLLNIPVTQTGSGTPSPDNIRNFIGFSGVNVSRIGKNLFDKNAITDSSYIDANGSINATPGWCVSDYIPVGIGNYIASRYAQSGTGVYLAVFDTNKNFVRTVQMNIGLGNTTRVTIGANEAFIRMSVRMSQIDTAQFEKGNQATDFVPYNGNTYQVSFGQTVYSTNLDVLTGKLSITHIRKAMSDLAWAIVTDEVSGLDYDYFRSSGIEDMNPTAFPVVSDCLVNNRHSRGELLDNEIGRYNPTNYNRRLVCRADSITTIEDWNTFIADKYIVYELATPIEIQLTPTQITTLIGENVIFADVGDITECKYTRK